MLPQPRNKSAAVMPWGERLENTAKLLTLCQELGDIRLGEDSVGWRDGIKSKPLETVGGR